MCVNQNVVDHFFCKIWSRARKGTTLFCLLRVGSTMQYLPSCVQLHRCKNYPSSGSMCLSRYMFACNSMLSLLCVCCGSIYITCLMLPVCVPVLLPARMRMIFFVKCSHCSIPHIPSHSTFYMLFVLLCVFHVIYLPVLGSRSLVSC